ncbi:MAG: ATP phosphoribosyltransferase regulatory subunit, partial [Zoogloeaceae bacterium]|nr:ATP phosphoribosyltransferase regulatory subunit [Zoogloeaceae bacterium]
LLTGAGQDLDLRTCKLADQLSGRTLGVRADMTPQVARIDAHLLNRPGVTRLCYCGSVLHALPASLASSREPIQIGAELYGYAGIAADLEILRLAADALSIAQLPAYRVDLSHVGLFRALTQAAGVDAETGETLFALLQGKDAPALEPLCATLPAPYGAAILRLTELYGGPEILETARNILPDLPEVRQALEALTQLVKALPELPLSVDLSDLRGYHYHNGVVFAAYCPGYPAAVALGGRYDGVGRSFGRARPATGFSLDLRELARLLPASAPKGAVLAPHVPGDAALVAKIAALRAAGVVVVTLLPGETLSSDPRCDHQLSRVGQDWILQAINA